MKLAKEQIQLIDDYLQEKFIKHWDIRLEIIDYIASEIEQKNINLNIEYLEKTLPYYKLTKIVSTHKKAINQKYKSLFIRKIKEYLNVKMLIFSIAWFLLNIISFNVFSFKGLVVLYFSTVMITLFFGVFYGIKNLLQGNKSYNLEMIFTYWVMFSSVGYLLVYLYKTNFPKHITVALFMTYSMVFFIKFLVGFRIYQKQLKQYSNIFNRYKTI